MTDILQPLRAFSETALEEIIRGAVPEGERIPAQIVAGYLGDLRFVAISASDGLVTASLSHPRRLPTRSDAVRFWAVWGIEPEVPDPRIFSGAARILFIVRRGSRGI